MDLSTIGDSKGSHLYMHTECPQHHSLKLLTKCFRIPTIEILFYLLTHLHPEFLGKVRGWFESGGGSFINPLILKDAHTCYFFNCWDIPLLHILLEHH